MVYKLFISSISGLIIMIFVVFFVAWLLENIIFFSLFVGIPIGLFIGSLAFFIIFHQLREK